MTPQRRDTFFGRRKGKPLRPGQQALVDKLLPRLVEAATGQRPFRGATFYELATAILHSEPPWEGDHAKSLPAGLVAVLARGLKKEPDERYSDMHALRRDLERSLTAAPRQLERR